MLAAAALLFSLAACESAPPAPPKKVTYKCLSSSCDATTTVNEGDPVPEHCGKKMIQ
jgi:hypothetical protein